MTQFPPGKLGGCLPRETRLGEGAFPVWGTDGNTPVLSRDVIAAATDGMLLNYHWHTINQSRQSSCTPSSLGNSMMLRREIEGKPRVVLSQASIYAFDGITIHDDGTYTLHTRRSDGGMNLEVAMLIAEVRGMAPRFRQDGTPYVKQYDYDQDNWPDDVVEVSASYRLGEAWDVPDYWAMQSALALGYAVCRGMDNHAVLQIKKDFVLGSWEDYGTGNNGLHEWGTSEREVNRGIATFGAWAFRCTAPSDATIVQGRVPDVPDNIRDRRRRRFGRR